MLQTKPLSQPRTMAFSVPQHYRTTQLPLCGSICGRGPDLIGTHSISLAARYRVAACSSTVRRGIEKFNEARGHNCTLLFALSPAWERDFLFHYMTFHTANAFDTVAAWIVTTLLTKFLKTNKKLPPVYFGQPSCTRLCWASLQSHHTSPATIQSSSYC